MAAWLPFALGSALFAGLTAILAKLGVAGINSNLATLLRTAVILLFTAAIVLWRREWGGLSSLSARSAIFLILSALATGLSWLCYFRALQLGPASLVAPVDKLGVAIAIILGVGLLGEPLTWKLALGGGLVVLGSLILAFG